MFLYAAMTSELEVESPCISNCCLDDNDICLGCFRSLSEITTWSQVDNKVRKKILGEADQRQKDHKLKYRSE